MFDYYICLGGVLYFCFIIYIFYCIIKDAIDAIEKNNQDDETSSSNDVSTGD